MINTGTLPESKINAYSGCEHDYWKGAGMYTCSKCGHLEWEITLIKNGTVKK